VITYGRGASLAWGPVRRLFLEHEIVADLCVVSQLSPLDLDEILAPALASDWVVTVEEGWGESGFGAEVAAQLSEVGFRGRFERIAAKPVSIPAARTLEQEVLPEEPAIERALERIASALRPSVRV
jgi:pyruvate dehydrogenase E1 component beta subunit